MPHHHALQQVTPSATCVSPKRLHSVIYFLARAAWHSASSWCLATPACRPALRVLLPFAFVLRVAPQASWPLEAWLWEASLLSCPDLVVSGVRSLSLEKQLVSSRKGVCPRVTRDWVLTGWNQVVPQVRVHCAKAAGKCWLGRGAGTRWAEVRGSRG